jgi:hypothetical protein
MTDSTILETDDWRITYLRSESPTKARVAVDRCGWVFSIGRQLAQVLPFRRKRNCKAAAVNQKVWAKGIVSTAQTVRSGSAAARVSQARRSSKHWTGGRRLRQIAAGLDAAVAPPNSCATSFSFASNQRRQSRNPCAARTSHNAIGWMGTGWHRFRYTVRLRGCISKCPPPWERTPYPPVGARIGRRLITFVLLGSHARQIF